MSNMRSSPESPTLRNLMSFKSVIVKDPHLCIGVGIPAGRQETFFVEQQAKLDFINQYIKDNAIQALWTTGDNFNYKNMAKYSVNTLNILQESTMNVTLLDNGEHIDWDTIAGNHDLPRSSVQMKPYSVFGLMKKAGIFHDLAEAPKTYGNVTIYGLDYNYSKEDLIEEIYAIKVDPNQVNILMVHEHLVPENQPIPFGHFISYEDLTSYAKQFDVIIGGHLHKGIPTQTLTVEDHSITFINPWCLTRLARDNYALDGTHTPELVELTVEDDGTISTKHVIIPHRTFDEGAFRISELKPTSDNDLDITEFVDSITDFEIASGTMDMSSLDQKVQDRIKEYLETATA